MICRVAVRDSHKCTSTRGTDPFVGDQFGFHRCPVRSRFHHSGPQVDQRVAWRRPPQSDVEICGDGAVRFIFTIARHQEMRRSPVRMTIQESSYDAAIQHAWKCLMMLLGPPFSNYFIALRIAVYMQPFRIGRPAAKADAVWRVFFLQRYSMRFHGVSFARHRIHFKYARPFYLVLST